MKVSVLGAGAVGSMIGGLLRHAAPDLDVTLIVHEEHGRAMHERQAVALDGPWGLRVVPVRCSFDPADAADSDLVLVAVKSQATEEVARAAQPYWPGATVVSIQNGINERLLARYVEPRRSIGCQHLPVAPMMPMTDALPLVSFPRTRKAPI